MLMSTWTDFGTTSQVFQRLSDLHTFLQSDLESNVVRKPVAEGNFLSHSLFEVPATATSSDNRLPWWDTYLKGFKLVYFRTKIETFWSSQV